MNITDIIALAKQGYKPSDIKELLEMAAPSVPPQQEDPGQDLSNVPSDPVQEDPEDTEDKQAAPEDPKEPDYKSMYEDLKKEIQHKNVRTNGQQEEPSLEDKMADLIRSIY